MDVTTSAYYQALSRAAGYNTASTDTARLNAVFEKAAKGGSITNGAGHNVTDGVSVDVEDLGVTVNGTTYENSRYVDRVVNWFDTTFQDSQVTKVNAGISGTPSFFGTFRLQKDVLQYNPDLVIVEFSVNDGGSYELDDGYMLDAYETIVRKCLESGAAVVTVFTVNNLTYTTTNIGSSWQAYHKEIADHYNVPTISYHNAIYPDGEWITAWTKLSGDNVHPNVVGHALLANCITSYFEDVYAMTSHASTEIPTEWLHNNTLENTEMICMDDESIEWSGMAYYADTTYGTIATNKSTGGTTDDYFKVKIPEGAKEIYVFYSNNYQDDGNCGFYTQLGDGERSEEYTTNNSSISYSKGEWHRVYNGDALTEDTDMKIINANTGKLKILRIFIVK